MSPAGRLPGQRDGYPDVESRIQDALQATLDAETVDVGALATRTRAAIRRRSRLARWLKIGSGAALIPAVGALALGPLGMAPGSGPSVVAPEPTVAPTVQATTSPTPDPSATEPRIPVDTARPDAERFRIVPWRIAERSADLNQLAYRIPSAVNLTVADLEQPGSREPQRGDFGGWPVVPGFVCDGDTVFPRPVAGKVFSWNTEDYHVDVVVTGWAPGTATARFAEIVRNDGRCRYDGPLRELGTDGIVDGDEKYAALGEWPWVAVRTGDLIVAASVYSDADDTAMASVARRLAGTVVSKAVREGLVDTAAAGGTR